jgi:hypothetical protein
MEAVFRHDALIGTERGPERHVGTLFHSLRDVEQRSRSERTFVIARPAVAQPALLAASGESVPFLIEREISGVNVGLTISSIFKTRSLIPSPDDAEGGRLRLR